MRCPKCGKELSADAAFCPFCGSTVNGAENQPFYPPPPSPNRNNKALIAVICVIAVLIIGVIAALASFVIYKGSSEEKATPSPIAATETPAPTPPPTPTPVPTQEVQVIYVTPTPTPYTNYSNAPSAADGYKTFYSSRYNFSCYYPASFNEYNDYGTATLYAVRSRDGLGEEKIAAKPNTGETPESEFNRYVSAHPGTVTYKTVGSDYFAANILNGNTEYYKYCKFRNGNLYWFEFNYPHSQHNVYDVFVNDVYNSININ